MKEIGLLVLLLLGDVISAYLLKSYALSQEKRQLIGALIIYLIYPFILLAALKYDGIGNINFYWNVGSTLLVYLIAVYFFQEKVSYTQALGIFLALLGIFLVVRSP